MVPYNPPIPRLDGMTEEQRNKALTDYMRESARQINLIAAQLAKELTNNDKKRK